MTLTRESAPAHDRPRLRDLRALFAPSSVAVLGASDDPTKYGNWISVQALAARDVRPVYLVNRRAERVLGERAYAQLADVPEPVELVVVAVPAAAFEAAVEDALAAGAKAIVGITAGFRELGAEGAARERAVVERVRAGGAVLLGPNCLGVVDTASRVQLASNPMPSGPVGLISQSGNMALELSSFLSGRGLGFSRFASLGNQADLTAADVLDAYVDHDGTELIAVYCEDFVDGRAFARSAARAVAAGKPVVLLTVGSSQASMRGAKSHTGALTSSNDVVAAAAAAAGMHLVRTPREMADLLVALRAPAWRTGRRLAVLADGGGHASLASDVAEACGMQVGEFGPDLVAALRDELPPSAGISNPVDLAGAGEQDVHSFPRTLALLLADPEVDAVLVSGYFGGYGAYGEPLAGAEVRAAHRMAADAATVGKLVIVHSMLDDAPALDALRAGGIPVFRAIEDGAAVLGRLADAAERAAPGVPDEPPPAPALPDDGYWTARELLRGAALPFPDARLASTPVAAEAAAATLGGPLVLKALGLLHKSDAGGVALSLPDAGAVRAAADDMAARLAPPGFSVERMADRQDGVELIVGTQRDPRFGLIAMVGLGGVFAEVLRDVAFALGPVDAATARAMLERLASAALLHGARGRPPVDLDAAAAAIAHITAVAARQPDIAELEVNPLLAGPAGCIGLDARVVLA